MKFEASTPQEAGMRKPVIDMAPILEKVLPIEGVFSPDEEVQKLWSVPREERRNAMASFKDKLARQKEAWALCRISIEKRIETNPNLPRDDMIEIIGTFASSYGFAESHKKVAELLVDDYIEMHKRVKEAREEFPDDIDLLNRLTGMKFSKSDADDFEIAVGPLSIEISCSGFNAGRIFERSEDPVVGFRYWGFVSQSRDKEHVYFLVVNRDKAGIGTLLHEREHQKNRILNPRLYDVREVRDGVREQLNKGVRGFLRHQISEKLLGFERKFRREIFQKYESAKDPEEKAFLLAEYMRLKRETALNRAKDEIIAQKIVDPLYIETLGYGYNYDIYFRQDGGAYDYLSKLRNRKDKKEDQLWQKTAQKVLVDEYRQIIGNAISAFDRLKDSGNSQEEVIAMLSDKRLAEWPKTARRLLEEK